MTDEDMLWADGDIFDFRCMGFESRCMGVYVYIYIYIYGIRVHMYGIRVHMYGSIYTYIQERRVKRKEKMADWIQWYVRREEGERGGRISSCYVPNRVPDWLED